VRGIFKPVYLDPHKVSAKKARLPKTNLHTSSLQFGVPFLIMENRSLTNLDNDKLRQYIWHRLLPRRGHVEEHNIPSIAGKCHM
jgi:hypothetical protein